MTRPTPQRLFEVLDATWPAARYLDIGPWLLREGQGGGQRVSAATAEAGFTPKDLACAAAEMARLGQRPLFMVRSNDQALDSALAAVNYEIVDPVTLYLVDTEALTRELPITAAIPSWPPLAIQRELWAAGGIGPARIAVMERAASPKTAILGRLGDAPVGTGFCGVHDHTAMVHALEVTPDARRNGVARRMMQAAANWAAKEGAAWMSLAVTRANTAANALYTNLGMEVAAQYHYRRAPENAP